jgi:hypothetical protein
MTGFIDTLYTPIWTTGNYSAIATSIFYSSLLYPPVCASLLHSPLVVSWQRIHKSHCHFKSHIKSHLHSLIPFLQLFCQLPIPELNSILILTAWDPCYIASVRPHRKHRFFYYYVPLHCCRDVFTAPLRSNEYGTDHRKHRSSTVARVRFHGNVFTEPLPSNELFLLSGVMSQYCEEFYGQRVSGQQER